MIRLLDIMRNQAYSFSKKVQHQLRKYGFHIARTPPVLPKHGHSLFSDLRPLLPREGRHILFDVGAHVGQTAEELLAHYKDSSLYCFEPVSQTFRILQKSFQDNLNVECHNIAFSSSRGEGDMICHISSDMSYLAGHSLL